MTSGPPRPPSGTAPGAARDSAAGGPSGDATPAGSFRRRLVLWLPVAAWILVIAVMSGDVASRSGTESSLLDLLSSLWPSLAAALQGAAWWEAAGWAVRKAAHLAEYGVLALLLLRAWRGDVELRRGARRAGAAGPRGDARTRRAAAPSAALVFLFCGLVASGDELHQAGVASRSGSAVDVGIDLLGAFLALAGVALVRRFRRETRGGR